MEDPSILASGKFVEQLLRGVAGREREIRLARKVVDLATLGRHLGAKGRR
jgi:hypothetical protein